MSRLLAQLKALVEPSLGETRVLLPALNANEGEHELRWSSSLVTWSVGGVQRRKWAYRDSKQPVVAASFAWFDIHRSQHSALSSSIDGTRSSSAKPRSSATFGLFSLLRDAPPPSYESASASHSGPTLCLCIFLHDIGHIYTYDGLEFTINVPFPIEKVWSLDPIGLMARASPSSGIFPGDQPAPTLYSLTAPFDEFRPVAQASHQGASSSLDPNEHVIHIYPRTRSPNPRTPTLLLTANPVLQQLRILRYTIRNPVSTPASSSPLPLPTPPDITVAPMITPLSPVAAFAGAEIAGAEESRRTSQTRNDLSVTLDRMAIDGNTTGETIRDNGAKAAGVTGVASALDSGRERAGEVVVRELWRGVGCKTESLEKYPEDMRFALFDNVAGQFSVALVGNTDAPVMTRFVNILDLRGEGDEMQLVPREPLHRCHAIEVCSLLATRAKEGLRDLLALRSNGSLYLITPGGDIDLEVDHGRRTSAASSSEAYCTAVIVPSPEVARGVEMDPTHSSQSGSSRYIVHLSDAADSFVTCTYSDGRALRVSTDLSPHSALVRSAFIVISHLCSALLVFQIRRRFLTLWTRVRHSATDDEEFACFSNAVIAALEASSVSPSPAADDVDPDDTDPWAQMAHHSIHRKLSNDRALSGLRLPQFTRPSPPVPRTHPEIPQLLHALHLLGEELKMDGLRRHTELPTLVPLLVQLAHSVGPDWVEYWLRITPDVQADWHLQASEHLMSRLSPPDLVGFIHTSLGVLTSSQFYIGLDLAREIYLPGNAPGTPSLEFGPAAGALDPLPMTTRLLAIFAALKDAADLGPSTTKERARKVVLAILEHGLTQADIDRLPVSVAAPLLEAIRTCQTYPPNDWSPEAYMLIGRIDLAKLAAGNVNESLSYGESYLNKVNSNDPHQHLQRQQAAHETIDVISEHSRVLSSLRMGVSVEADPSRANFSVVRFAQDQRLAEVEVILDSSRVPNVKIPDRPDLNEQDLAKELAVTVNHIVERTFAQPFGRAIYTFGSVSRLTRDEYFVPPVEMQVKFVPHNVTYPPDMTKIHPEAKQWVEFHNGVAASLRLNPYAPGVDSSWIAFNKPQDLTPEHAGYLLGLGLTGHLRTMWNWHGYRYLVPKHEPTSIAILLGLGASHIGSADTEVTRLLTIHMRPLLPPDSAELGIPLGAQSAALMGLGLLYLGTGDRTMGDVALQELSVAHLSGGPEISNEHREAYTITAGLSYGLIMCGLGSRASGPTDEANLRKLRAFVAGKEYSSMSIPAGGLPGTSGSTTGINMNFVSPAATIALALMYLKTNRADIAASFALPPDPAGLKDIQPSLLLLRALGRSLIMWDEITPSVPWVLNQAQRTPKDLTKKQLQEGVKELYEFAFFNILSGACLAIGLKYAGTATAAANHVLIHFHDKLLENLRRQPPGQSFDIQLRRAFIREAINVVDLALGLVMAGTGDVGVMQRLRIRHGLFGPHIRYGAHIATHMALGFLFLGGGRYTLGTSNAAVACLVASLFPRFPLHTNETRGLLQAFRHLWVLAVEPRCLIARDADTNEITQIPVKIKISEAPGEPVRTHQFICPTLLPDFSRFLSIKVDTPRYWPFTLNIADDERARTALLRTQTIYVKRRSGVLSHVEDPTGIHSITGWSGSPAGDSALLDFPSTNPSVIASSSSALALPRSFHDMRHFARTSTNEGWLLAFADRFCRYTGRNTNEVVTLSYAQQTLLEALSNDKPQIIPALLNIFQMRIFSPEESPMGGWNARDLHLANEFYSMLFRYHGMMIDAAPQRSPLLRTAALQGAITMLGMKADELRGDSNFIPIFRSYGQGEDVGPHIFGGVESEDWRQALRLLAFVLQQERVPSSQTLQALRRLAGTAIPPARPGMAQADWPATRVSLALVVQKTALSLSGPRQVPWSLRSVADFLELWFAPAP